MTTTMKRGYIILIIFVLLVIAAGAYVFYKSKKNGKPAVNPQVEIEPLELQQFGDEDNDGFVIINGHLVSVEDAANYESTNI
ncbi:MAG: hypothetical protein EOL95_01415 [Bacteroidia bacterium]|nr:hypothetical protein [Bacteroidia bacterium]